MTDGTTLQRNPSTITDFPTIVPKKRHTEFFSNEALPRGVKSAVSFLSLDLLKKEKKILVLRSFANN